MWLLLLSLAHAAGLPGLPLKAISYEVEVSGSVAEIVVRQTFHADGPEAIEATYTFPLPAEGAVDAMRMEVGDRVIEGEIRDREAARLIYADAVATGHLAALTEQERPNVFTQRVGNIPPGADVAVELRVLMPVLRKEGAWELVLPLVVAPRFIPTGQPDGAAFDKPYTTGDTGVDVDIDVAVHAGLPIRRIESPSHDIHATLDGDDAAAKLDDIRPDADLVLRWWTASDAPQVGLLVNGAHALLVFEPPERSDYAARVPRELMFVLDRSCSMTGEPFELARAAMLAALDQLDPADSFQLASFSDKLEPLWRDSRPATERNVREAREEVGRLQPDGGTQMRAAVGGLLAAPVDAGRHRIVVLLSDGQVSNDDEVLQAIAAHPEATVATIGIGASPNRALLDQMAGLGGGAAAYVTLKEDPQAAMEHMLAVMDRPVLTEARVDWGAWNATAMYPTRLPDLRAGQPVVVVARVDPAGAGPVRVSGRVGSGSFTQVVQPEPIASERALATTFARQKVADLHRRKLLGEIGDERPAILATALEYHILSDYTAFVAVEWDRVANPGGRPQQVDQILELPVEHAYVLDGVKSTDPVTGTFSAQIPGGRAYQGDIMVESTRAAIDSWSAPTPLRAPQVDEGRPFGTNRWHAQVMGSGSSARVGPQGAKLRAEVAGPLRVDKAWVSAGYAQDRARVGPVELRAHETFATLAVWPNLHNRLMGAFDADPMTAVDTAESRYGGADAGLRWQHFYNPEWMSEVWAEAGRDQAGEDRRADQRAGAWVRALEQQDGLGNRHEPWLGLSADRRVWLDRTEEARATVAALSLDERLERDRLALQAGARVALRQAEGGQDDGRSWLYSPTLAGTWRPSMNTALYLGGSRDWDAARAVAPTRADRAWIELRQELLGDLAASGEAHLRADQLPFAPPPEWTTLEATLAAPSITPRALGTELGLHGRWGQRRFFTLTWAWSRPLEADAELLSQPVAFWVPELLDAHRPHRVDGAVSWAVSLGNTTLEAEAFGSWASAIAGPQEAWWLDPTRALGADLGFRIGLRRFYLLPGFGATFASNTTDTSLLPVEVLTHEAGAPSIEALPPWLLRARLSVGF